MMLIDIRDKEKYLKGHLNGAVSIPFLELFLNPNRLSKDKEYTLYCDTGSKSKILVNHLNKLGYHCVNLDGGYLFH